MKKQMLNEGEIRKMMKFANIQKLTENFLDTQIAEEEELELDAEEEIPLGDEGALELAAEEEVEIEPEGPKSNEEIAQQLAAGVAELLSQVLDVHVESETDGDLEDDGLGEPEAEVEVEDELDVDVEEPGGRDMYEETADKNDGLEPDAEELEERTSYGHEETGDKKELDEEWGGKTGDRKRGGADKHDKVDTEEEEDKADYEKPTSKAGKERRKKAGLTDEALKNEDLVNEITRRVASRLLALKNK